jgi:hypothetical protein
MAVIDGLIRMPIVYRYAPDTQSLEHEEEPDEASI